MTAMTLSESHAQAYVCFRCGRLFVLSSRATARPPRLNDVRLEKAFRQMIHRIFMSGCLSSE